MTTFDQLCRLQPALRTLERDALAAHKPGPVDWDEYEQLKARLGRLVGWWCGARDSRLVEGWDVAYPHILACWETDRMHSSERGETRAVPGMWRGWRSTRSPERESRGKEDRESHRVWQDSRRGVLTEDQDRPAARWGECRIAAPVGVRILPELARQQLHPPGSALWFPRAR